ncbi:unnamed protein product [Chilo suppressalis]|uniref:C2H2-type domain-containing protein n=1 Tax=Chilo suppressalis TaxID=168631 RepID=A0ABN8BAN0_CHISP|nr:hypothetical protein evm_014575 [Chilo suppressalis]CAH0405839.1 unnamed protein product [Chilo suppressalis]
MIVFPHWRPDVASDGCRVQRWMPAEHFGSYIARPVAVQQLPPPLPEDEDSSGGSSPERNSECLDGGTNVCEWRGCGSRYPSIARLSAHVARAHAHAHTDGHFYCGWKNCRRPQRGFNARYKMLVHVRTHTNERPHTCNQCSKSFSRAENLKIHLRSHSGEKPYVCPYEGCGKAYSNSSDRFKHTRTHTVDKPYFCKVPGCNKRYTDPSSLRKHVKTNKHFTKEEDVRRESSDEIQSPEVAISSPTNDTNPCHTVIKPSSPYHMHSPIQMHYSPVRTSSPTMAYSPALPLREPSMSYPLVNPVTYIEPMYPVRVPSHEMSYIEYTHMYEHAYRSYYSNSIGYPVLPQRINEKVYKYDITTQYDEVEMEEHRENDRYDIVPEEEMPLNLICTKQRIECKPIEQLVKRTDLPLDLSTKS